jgi:hypothetical protein
MVQMVLYGIILGRRSAMVEGIHWSETDKRPPLDTLHIELENNHIGDEGALWLSGIGRNVYGGGIHTLHLGCKNNGIGDLGAQSFADFIPQSNVLGHIHLNLDQNLIGADGFAAVTRMHMLNPMQSVVVEHIFEI